MHPTNNYLTVINHQSSIIMLGCFIPTEQIRLARAKTVETQGLATSTERKEYLKENFNFDWVQKMPLDMVREFHKHLDYGSRVEELLAKHPFIMSIDPTMNLTSVFTATQIEKIFQQGFIKKLCETTRNTRNIRLEAVQLLPETHTMRYIDARGSMI
jgi:hypothetical protein